MAAPRFDFEIADLLGLVSLAAFVLLGTNMITTRNGELPERIDDAHFIQVLFKKTGSWKDFNHSLTSFDESNARNKLD